MPTTPQRFRFLPGRPMVAVVAALMGAGLVASALFDTPLPGRAVATGTGGMALGGAVIALALVYLFSPAWRTEVVVDDDALEVVTRGDRGFRLAWTDVVRVVAAPARASAFVDGGDPRRSLLLPGAGARAPYRIADQRRLYDFIRAHVPADRVSEVQRLRPTEAAPAAGQPTTAMSYFSSTTITTDAALRDLSSPRSKVRAAAASALAECEPTRRAEVAVGLLAAIDDDDAEVRAAAALSLGELGADGDLPDLADLGDSGPRPADALILRLDDGAPAVRQCAAVALARMKATAALEPLRRALADGPPDLRFQAATSLVEIDPAAAAAPLIAALRDADGEVAGAAALGLGAIGDAAAAPAIAALLEHARPRTRFDAAYALAELGDERAVPFLAQAAAERDLAWDAIEALETIGRPAADALARLVASERTLDPEHRLRAAAALLAAAPDHAQAAAAQRALLDPLRSWWRRRRGLAIDLLARVGGPWATAPLEQLRNSPAGRRLADEITEALRRIRDRAAT